MPQKHKNFYFHKFILSFSRKFIVPKLLKKYTFTTDFVNKLDEPCLIMANHTTESDMLMMIAAIKQHFYFVCGEHLFRSKYRKQIRFLYDPIPEFKGAKATKTVHEIFNRIKQGHSIMIFPEGSRSFNGETIKQKISCGKMVKIAKCGLITYHIEGGYFVAPRWGYKFRKGHMEGHVVHKYTSEELQKMSVQEITDHINQDIYENAYETQRKKMIPYTSDYKAEGIENYLIICPNCHSYDSFESSGNEFYCKCCKEKATYDDYGFIHSEKFKFDNVYDWGKWIETEFDSDMNQKTDDEFLFTEKNLKIYQITQDHKTIDLDAGEMKVFKDRMEICGRIFRFSDIVAMNMLYFGKTLLFTHENINYGITGEAFHAWKCDRLYQLENKKC